MELSKQVDGILTQKLPPNSFEIIYIDITTPEVLDYIDDVNTIVENRLPLPYVALGHKPICFGEEDAQRIAERIFEKIKHKGWVK